MHQSWKQRSFLSFESFEIVQKSNSARLWRQEFLELRTRKSQSGKNFRNRNARAIRLVHRTRITTQRSRFRRVSRRRPPRGFEIHSRPPLAGQNVPKLSGGGIRQSKQSFANFTVSRWIPQRAFMQGRLLESRLERFFRVFAILGPPTQMSVRSTRVPRDRLPKRTFWPRAMD